MSLAVTELLTRRENGRLGQCAGMSLEERNRILVLRPTAVDKSSVRRASVSRRLLFASGAVIVALICSGVSACLQTSGQRRATLRRAAVELLPPQARIRALGFGDCVELASGPSCARVVFALPQRSSVLRARALRRTALRNGWTIDKMDDAEGGWSLFLRRPGFTAFAVLWRPDVYNLRCGGEHPDDRCFNTIDLERSS